MNNQNVHHIGKDEKEKRPIFRATIETQEIYKRLTEANPGDVITYLELSELIGKNVQKDGNSHIQSAKRMLLNDGKVFEAVANVGVKYCNDSESLHSGIAGIRRVRKAVKKSRKKMLCAEFDKLTSSDKIKFNTEFSLSGALECFLKPKTVSKIEQKVMMTGKHIPYEDTLDLFRR